jgi:hypothetical protein
LSGPELRTLSSDAPASGFVQPDRIKLTVPAAFGIDTPSASAGEPTRGPVAQQKAANGEPALTPDPRMKVQAYHEGNPPPSGVVLGSIEIEFVVAAKR